jgi:hypothetical protein
LQARLGVISLALPRNVRLGWKRMTVRNTLGCHDTEKITTVKSFTAEASYHFILQILHTMTTKVKIETKKKQCGGNLHLRIG